MQSASFIPQIKKLEEKLTKEKFKIYEGGLSKLKIVAEKLAKKEDDLKILNQAYTDLFNYSSIGICEVGLDGKFLSVNDAWCKMCKRTRFELLKLTWMQITKPEFVKKDTSKVKKLISKEIKSYTMFKEYFDKDNNAIPMILTVSCVFDSNGKVKNFISQGIDIEGTKKLLEDLKNG